MPRPTSRCSIAWPARRARRGPPGGARLRQYLGRLAEADCCCCLDPDVYRWRGWGVFTDAHHVGISVVAPKECAFARPDFDGGWGVAMREYDGKSLGIAVLAALDRLAPLSACAVEAAAQVRDDLGRVLGASLEGLAGRPGGLPASCANSGRDMPQDLPKFGSNPRALGAIVVSSSGTAKTTFNRGFSRG